VAGALDMREGIRAFHRPRKVLDPRLLEARIGAATGVLYLGHVGTHGKVDFTGVGPTTKQAARLQGEAPPGTVCVSEATYGRIRGQYAVRDDKSLSVTL
jgi:class 3 adenylate cyclase